jgi:hypothetical protein
VIVPIAIEAGCLTTLSKSDLFNTAPMPNIVTAKKSSI